MGFTRSLTRDLRQDIFGGFIRGPKFWDGDFSTGAGDLESIVLFETSFNDSTDEASFSTTAFGTLYWATHLTGEVITANSLGGWTGSTLETGDTLITAITDVYPIPYTATTGTTGQTRKVSYYIRNGSIDSNLITEQFVIN